MGVGSSEISTRVTRSAFAATLASTDDALNITLPAFLASEVRAAARARGVTPEAYVHQQLAFEVALGSDQDVDGDDIEADLAAAADFEHTGVGVPWDEVRAWMASWGTADELPRPTPRKLR